VKIALRASTSLAFDNLKEEYDCVLGEGVDQYRKLGVEYGKIVFKRIAKKGVKIKILIVGKKNNSARVEAMKQSMPKSNYEIRSVIAKDIIPCPNFALIDSRELWLRVASLGKGATILTDVKEIVEMAKNQFEALWADPKTKIEAQPSTLET